MITCLFAATVAIVQDDIKKVIAYSTCSQLGYMFLACGVSALLGRRIFFIYLSCIFKAFILVAGNIIVALHHEQNIKKWKKK